MHTHTHLHCYNKLRIHMQLYTYGYAGFMIGHKLLLCTIYVCDKCSTTCILKIFGRLPILRLGLHRFPQKFPKMLLEIPKHFLYCAYNYKASYSVSYCAQYMLVIYLLASYVVN